MALPIQVDGGGTLGTQNHARVGPFFYGGGVYVLSLPGLDRVRCWKATSPTAGFTAQHTAGEAAMGTSFQNVAAVLDGSKIHIVAQTNTNLYYRVFDCATNTWVTAETIVAGSGPAIVDIAVRSTGEVVVGYSTSGGVAVYRRRTGVNTWTATVTLNSNGSFAGLVLGANDRIHFFYVSGTTFVQRTLTSANALQAEQVLGSGVTDSNRLGGRPGRYATSGGTVRLIVAWSPTGATNPSVAVADSADAPAWTTTATALDSATLSGNSPPVACVTNDTNEYVAYVSAGPTVKDANRAKGGAFGVDTTDEVFGANSVSAAAYHNGTDWKLGLVYSNGSSVVRYTERTVTGPSFGQNVAVGRADETDTAQPLAEAKAKAIGLATSAETAMPITARKSVPLGLVIEADGAFVIVPTRNVMVTLGMAEETSEAGPVAALKQQAIGVAVEEDFAQGIGAAKARGLALATEAELATSVEGSKDVALGLASETEVAFGLARLKAFALGLAGETDVALPFVTSLPNRLVTLYALVDGVASPEGSSPLSSRDVFTDSASDGGAILEDLP